MTNRQFSNFEQRMEAFGERGKEASYFWVINLGVCAVIIFFFVWGWLAMHLITEDDVLHPEKPNIKFMDDQGDRRQQP